MQSLCTVRECAAALIGYAGLGRRHINVPGSYGDAGVRLLLDKYTAAQSLRLPRGLTEMTISTLKDFPRIRFLDVTRNRSALCINELVQLQGVTTMLAWFNSSQEQLGEWRLCTMCDNLTTLKHMSITENCFAHAVPVDWQEKLNCLTQLKLLESLASKLIPSPACIAALTNLTRLELSCFYDRDCHLNPVMDIVPSLPRLEALRLGLCPSKRHLQSLSRMPHLTLLVVGHPLGRGTTMDVRDVCSLRDVHELCCMAIVKNLDCQLQISGNTHVHVWSQGQADDKVHFCIPGTKYKLTVM